MRWWFHRHRWLVLSTLYYRTLGGTVTEASRKCLDCGALGKADFQGNFSVTELNDWLPP